MKIRLITRTVSALLLAAVPHFLSAGDRVYQYAMADGSILFTDTKLKNADPIKVKYYGRPAAHHHCAKLGSEARQKRIKGYLPYIEMLSAQYNVDPDLVQAVIATESCYDSKAVSRVGAQGLMQLMPATASMLGVKDPFDPKDNIEGGIKYLRQMLDEFKNDKKLALAAYNAGPGAVRRYGGIPPFKETRGYVKKVLSLYRG